MSLDRIPVDSKWLIPAVKKEWRKVRDVPVKPLATSLAVKPRGQLPPPIPRDDEEEVTDPARKPSKTGARSNRPPPSKPK